MQQESSTMSQPPPPPAWKLYDNPHYAHHPYKCRLTKSRSSLHGRGSDFSDFFRAMEREPDLSDLDNAIAHIKQLRAELDFERRMRRRVESVNRSLSRDLEEERRRRESAEEACRKLTDKIACVHDRERALPKNNATEEKVGADEVGNNSIISSTKTKTTSAATKTADGELGLQQRKEVENPHIKRGIKGLEFPRVVRARGSGGSGGGGGGGTGNPPSSNSREGRPGSNLECQRAQLRVLLRQRSPAGSGLMAAAHNLVM
ncbi:protein BRANCHLESS TRICHOME-like [Iris pallida]|uniref:Protein BRANCHLESS TRICHOME-like n=1 Tax=Iris pallida TaxID=29817 RepID=A0AAX6GM29_IRIPA|nr:protein BRANCHLESS TRICHOME-like [Iris pallida]